MTCLWHRGGWTQALGVWHCDRVYRTPFVEVMKDDTMVSEIFTCSPWDSCVLVGIHGEYPCLICGIEADDLMHWDYGIVIGYIVPPLSRYGFVLDDIVIGYIVPPLSRYWIVHETLWVGILYPLCRDIVRHCEWVYCTPFVEILIHSDRVYCTPCVGITEGWSWGVWGCL